MSAINVHEFVENAKKLTADQILKITENNPEKLFLLPEKDKVKSIYRALSIQWHPDKNKSPESEDVFKHVAILYKKAGEKIDQGSWEDPSKLILKTRDAKTIKINYLKKHDFELGSSYISNSLITYVVDKKYTDLFKKSVRNIKALEFANNHMRDNFARCLPEIYAINETATDHVLTIKKPKDFVLLDDLLEHENKKMDPKHVAWMMSRLHNISAYLQWSGMTHNAINTKNCFVSPENHSIALLGGWWYATKENTPILGLPNETVSLAPRSVLEKGLADKRTDMALIRHTWRQLLGDKTGVRLSSDPDIPKPMVDWVCLPGTGDAFEDYKIWMDKVLIDSFGKRRFHKFNVSPSDIYQP